jgi:peroxiredoxin
MRADIIPGARFPDYELTDHTRTRRLSELQGNDPLILVLSRGHYCPKDHQQHLELAAFYPKIAVAYTQIVTIATDNILELNEFRDSVGAQWTFLSDPRRTVQQDLEIQEYTTYLCARAGAGDLLNLQRLLVLGTPIGRGSAPRSPRGHAQDPPRLGACHAGLRENWDSDKRLHWPYTARDQ